MDITPAIIFDMDGVIFNNVEFHNKAWKMFAGKYDLRFEDDFKTQVFGGTNREHLERLFGKALSNEEV